MFIEENPLGWGWKFMDVYYNVFTDIDVDTVVSRMERSRRKLKDILPLPEIVSIRYYVNKWEWVNYRFLFEKITKS